MQEELETEGLESFSSGIRKVATEFHLEQPEFIAKFKKQCKISSRSGIVRWFSKGPWFDFHNLLRMITSAFQFHSNSSPWYTLMQALIEKGILP